MFTTSLAEGVKDAEVVFLALPTPPGADGSADMRYVLGVADDLGKIMNGYKVVVDKSTVPVGTAEKVREAIAANYKGEFDVVRKDTALIADCKNLTARTASYMLKASTSTATFTDMVLTSVATSRQATATEALRDSFKFEAKSISVS